MKLTRMSNVWRLGIVLLVLALMGTGGDIIAQSRPAGADTLDFMLAKPDALARPADGWGIFVAGDYWETYMPANTGPYYGENSALTIQTFIRLGNLDRLWSEPTHIWPGGWNTTAFWAKWMYMTEFNPDDTFNPETVGGNPNPSYVESSGPNYAAASFAPNPSTPGAKVAGWDDPTRNYAIETKYVDAKRHKAIYEAGWPTNLGVDVKLKVHQWSLNWNSFDDFHILEMQLTNTGNVDINCDGTVERTNNEIRALTLFIGGEVAMSAYINTAGNRSSHWGTGRTSGYVGDPDPTGAPWAIHAVYPGEATDGAGNFGNNSGSYRQYTDIWSGWTWLGAVQGTDPNGPVKQTIFGTHPVGEGPQRGWYWTSGDATGLSASPSNPKSLHTCSMGTWYTDGGKSRDQAKYDLKPNPNFFESGTEGDPTTFVPKASPSRPNGTRMMLSNDLGAAAFEKAVFEPGWTMGYSSAQNFDAASYAGFGPIGMAVGETVTIYLAQGSGFRLMGLANAMSAARYMLAQGLPDDGPVDYPAVPKMRTDNTLNKTVKVSWDNASANHSNFGGYKIYRADLARAIDFLDEGIRVVDNYWRQMEPSPVVAEEFKRPVNPRYPTSWNSRKTAPDAWGPYHLLKVIPAAELGQYADNANPNFQYAWEDPSIVIGFKYWYYVSAYTRTGYDLGQTWVTYPLADGSPSNPATTSFVETSNINRNGATGLWEGTYPFADRNPFYPTTNTGLQAMGAGFVVYSALADANDIVSGAAKIGVKPNPYKKKALFDSASEASDHKVVFYNLPPRATITILDVSGQIIDEIVFESDDPNVGSVFWDLFAKNGAEVASGLYIYVVDYEVARGITVEKGQHVGYLTIMR